MNRQLIYFLQAAFWLFVILLFFLSAYTLLHSNFNDLLGKQEWEFMGNIANVLGVLGVIIPLFIVLPLKALNKLKQRLLRDNFPSDGQFSPEMKTYQGIVFTVSRANLPLWVIDHCQPKVIGLLGSRVSAGHLEEISAHARKAGIEVISRILENPDNVARSKKESEEMIQEMQEQGYGPIAFDLTGGKTPMSLGAFLAAEKEGLDSLYVTAQYDDKGPVSSSITPVLLSSRQKP